MTGITVMAKPIMLKHRLQTVQTALCSLENFDCYNPRDTDKLIHDISRNRLRQVSNFTSIMQFFQAGEKNYVFSLYSPLLGLFPNLDLKVILASCQRYGRQIITSGKMEFLSQKSSISSPGSFWLLVSGIVTK